MAETRLVNFLNSPVMAWVRTYEDRYVCDTVEALADGIILNEIMQKIYPESNSSMVNTEVNGDANLRAQNLTVLMQSIRLFFESYLQQLVVMQLPDIMAIAYEPETDYSLDQLEKILLLLLGCAVQCEAKEKLIEGIKRMDSSMQSSLVGLIQEITHNPDNVYGMDFENLSGFSRKDLETECQNVYIRLKRVTRERDNYYASFSEVSQERNHVRRELLSCSGRPPSSPLSTAASRNSFTGDGATAGLVASQAEVLGLRAKLRELTEQLDLKSLSLSESHKEMIMLQEKITKLQQEKQRMLEEVQWSRDHHDELDTLRVKARRIDQLETENSKYRRRLEDMEHVHKLVKEVKNEKQLLVEGKKSLEAEVDRLNSRFSSLDGVEMENAKLRQQIRAMTEEKESDMEKLQSLVEHNAKLELNTQQDAEQLEEMRQELDTLRFATPAGAATPSLANTEFNFANQTPDRPVAEALQSRLTELERDNRELERVTSDLRDARLRVSTLEEQNKKMQSQRFNEKKELAIAREELKREREKVGQAEEGKKKMREDLQRDFAQREHQLQAQLIEEKRNYLNLEQRLDDVAQRRAELAQDRITGLEGRLDSSEKEKLQLRQELTSTSEELATVSVQLVTSNQSLRSKSDKHAVASEEVGVANEKLRYAQSELEELRRSVRNLEQQYANEVKRSEGMSQLLQEEKSRSDRLEQLQVDLKKQAENLEVHFGEEKTRAAGLLQGQADWKERADSLEQHYAEERSRTEALLQRQAEELQAAITQASNQAAVVAVQEKTVVVEKAPPKPETSEMGVQTEVELWLEQVVALAQAHGFLGGPAEEDVPSADDDNHRAGTPLSGDEAAENSSKPTQAVAPVKASQTPILPAFVTAELAKTATSVQSTKVVTPRAAAAMLLSSSPALKRAVSSLIASPGGSPLLSRSSGITPQKGVSGVAMMPAVVGVMESIRGVMETVGTPTPEHKTMAGGIRQEDAEAVKRALSFPGDEGNAVNISDERSPQPGGDSTKSMDVAVDPNYDPDSLKAELRSMKQEYTALETQMHTIKRQYQGEQADLESEIRNLRRQLHASRMQIAELNDEIGRIRKQLRTARTQNASTEEELTHSRHQVQSTRQQLQEARQQLHAAGAQLQVSQMTIHQLETQSTQIESNNEVLSNRCDCLESLNTQLSDEYKNVFAEVKKLLFENRELRMRNDEAKDKFIGEERLYSDRLAELEHERGRLTEQLESVKKVKPKKKGTLSKVAKRARNLLGVEKERHAAAAGNQRIDGYDSSSSGGTLGAGTVPHSASMPRIVGRDRADTMPASMSSMTGSGSLESFGGSVVQLAGIPKTRSIGGSINDTSTMGSTHSPEDDEAAAQLEQLMSGLARMDSPSNRASMVTASPGSRHRVGSEVVTLEDFLKETDKTPSSRRRMFNEAGTAQTPPGSRKSTGSAGPAGAIMPRREVSTMDAPAFLESLKSMPLRQQQEPFQRQKPIHPGRSLLRPASSGTSSQASADQVFERSGSATAVPVMATLSAGGASGGVGVARRLVNNSSASSLDSHSASASPLTLSHSGLPRSSSGNVVAVAATPPPGRDRDSAGSHQPLTRKRALVDTGSLGSGRLGESLSSAPLRTSTPSSGASLGKYGEDEPDMMTALDAIRSGGAADVGLGAHHDCEAESGGRASSQSVPVIHELAHSPTRPSPRQHRAASGRASPIAVDAPRPDSGGGGEEASPDASWFEYGCV